MFSEVGMMFPRRISFIDDFSRGAIGINLLIGISTVVALTVAVWRPSALAQQSTQDLATAAQNPIAAMYSLPFQNNAYFGVGPNHNETANALNIQPVLPFTFGDVTIISRTIAPLIRLPGLANDNADITSSTPFGGSHFGLGDINQSLFFGPTNPGELIWGVGPSFSLPTATAKPVGSGKFSMGPVAVALVTPKPWVVGIYARQLWSVVGPSDRANVSQLLLQPFVNYNLPEGWYLTSSPIITANWNERPGDRWNFPIGGGIGKILKIGDQPINLGLQAFDYIQSPSGGPRWTLRFQVQFLFPR
jgi:hypothetical protein